MSKPKYQPTMPHPAVTDELSALIEAGAEVATPSQIVKAALPHLRELVSKLGGSDERSPR